MVSMLSIAVAIVVGLAAGGAFAVFYRQYLTSKLGDIQSQKDSLLKDAEKAAASIRKEASVEARDVVLQAKAEVEAELKERRNEVGQTEKRLRQKEETLEKKLEQAEKKDSDLQKRDKELNNRERSISDKENRQNELIAEQTKELERIAGSTTEEARAELFKKVEEAAQHDALKVAKRIEDEVKEGALKKAKEVISNAIQRYASDYVADAAVSSVTLPNDEIKGRIIGREGRNIRALEAATGVDFIVDDTPEVVTLSAFDPVRREIARLALERLMTDGRIHPARIEEVVEKVKKEIDSAMLEAGEAAVFELGLTGIHPELIKVLGRLKYRSSYGQNVLMHSREVAYLAGMMAAELGGDVKLAKRGGLLHDIGKAIDHEVEGPHNEIGAVLAKKYGENSKIINAIVAHHGDTEVECMESALVAAADALSAARPGVRRESIENYIKRLQKLEELALSFNGVEKCYAIQAGREVRIIVKPEMVNDEMSWSIAKDLAKKIEDEMTYPGQIKVMVIRESRHVEFAK